MCRKVCAGHCASPLAFVTALQLAEEDAEAAVGADDGSACGSGRQQRVAMAPLVQRFLHQHPGCGAQLAGGLTAAANEH